jgi:hypothetical protein
MDFERFRSPRCCCSFFDKRRRPSPDPGHTLLVLLSSVLVVLLVVVLVGRTGTGAGATFITLLLVKFPVFFGGSVEFLFLLLLNDRGFPTTVAVISSFFGISFLDKSELLILIMELINKTQILMF